MLVATPGQTSSYSTLHNSNTNGGGSNNSTAATSTTKKSSTSSTTAGTAKSLNNNNNHATSTITTKSSLNLNTTSTTHTNYHSNTKNDNIVLNKLSNQNKSTATSSREIISSSKQAATTHSSKPENSTKTTSTTNSKQQSFIQTLKDSVQKALITTTGSSSNSVSTATKQNNCNNSKTSFNNVTSSSSAASHNANKPSTITSSNTLNYSTSVTQSSSSASVARGKYFSCSLSKLHTVAPTIIHRHPEERQHANSTDSLHKEMCHFKPIRIVPKTPWKSGSKSRGNSLRFPKANLATKKTEFVLKSNCDVNNRKKKQQQIDKVIVTADEDDDNEQENKEFHRIYKPKPSLTSLSTSINTPNHTSAFVCLIADMKDLVNLQSKNQLCSKFEEEEEELFTRKKQRPSKKQLQTEEIIEDTPMTRGKRKPPKTAAKETNAKIPNTSKVSNSAVLKVKSRRNVGRAKSKNVDMVALAKDKLKMSLSAPDVTVLSKIKGTRKRKIALDDNDTTQQELISTLSISPLLTKSASNKTTLLTSRRSSRLTALRPSAPSKKRLKYSLNPDSSQTTSKSSPKTQLKPTTVVRFSPIMTRSRHKLLTEQGKIVETAVNVIKKRKT